MHCVDLGESFPTSFYLQKSASIQPRTSPSKFGGKFNSIFIRLLRPNAEEPHHTPAIGGNALLESKGSESSGKESNDKGSKAQGTVDCEGEK